MLLSTIFIILLFSIFILNFISEKEIKLIQKIGIISSGLVFFLSTLVISNFKFNNYEFQYLIKYSVEFEILGFDFILGLDGISIYFFYLSSFLIFLCILFIWEEKLIKIFTINLLILNLLLLLVFSTLNILFFYIFFEAILIPMYLIIGTYGSRERKIRAVYLFFFFTFIGSLLMLIGILYIYINFGSLNLELIFLQNFTFQEQYWLWLAFFFSFASKIPLFPFHIWLPEAHVEAPTIGSVLLAGILLKLGIYGILRFNLTIFPLASIYFSPIVYLLGILGILFSSLTALRQTDLKRIIAYSSIAHMNLVTLGIFSFNTLGIEGSILQSLSHGFISGAMFLLIGIIYNRYHSRFLFYYGGLIHVMPFFSSFFLIFTFANIALPGTSSFTGEFMILAGISKISLICCFLAAISVILGGAYSLWLYNKIIFGNLKINNTLFFKDLYFREFIILLPLALLTIFMGIYPNFFLKYLHFSCINIFSIYTNL